jgi:hypothetical protein
MNALISQMNPLKRPCGVEAVRHWNLEGADWLCMGGGLEAIMLHRWLSHDTHEHRRLSDTTIIMGIVSVCVLMVVALLGAGMLDPVGKSTTQPSRPVITQSDTQAPALPQPSTQAPAENPH